MLAINGHSMVTSFGFNAATACAAARAGLTRASQIEGFSLHSDVEGTFEPVIAHAVPFLTRGFEENARLQRLLFSGLNELKKEISTRKIGLNSVGFYLSLPDPQRISTGLMLIPDEDTRMLYESDDIDPEEFSTTAHMLLTSAAQQVEWDGILDIRYISVAGHAGGTECVAAACRDINNGIVELAIVGAVDSLIDEGTLNWLNSTGRLKLSDMPVGMIPGEACAFLALSKRSENAQAEIASIGLATEPSTLLSGLTSIGKGLAEAIDKAYGQVAPLQSSNVWIIGDQNGELYRANEWGHGLVRVHATWPELEIPLVSFPVVSFGDTGAASALIAICTAIHAFERKYAPTKSAMIISSSETELRSALIIKCIDV